MRSDGGQNGGLLQPRRRVLLHANTPTAQPSCWLASAGEPCSLCDASPLQRCGANMGGGVPYLCSRTLKSCGNPHVIICYFRQPQVFPHRRWPNACLLFVSLPLLANPLVTVSCFFKGLIKRVSLLPPLDGYLHPPDTAAAPPAHSEGNFTPT